MHNKTLKYLLKNIHTKTGSPDNKMYYESLADDKIIKIILEYGDYGVMSISAKMQYTQ